LALLKDKINEEYFNNIDNLINKFNLTPKKINFDRRKVIELMLQDKKVVNRRINLLLPTAPAVVELFDNIDSLSIEASLP
jgi:3-dehydroquinate synthetase